MTTALITGGNRGIGRAIAEALHALGMDTVIAARSGGAEAAKAIGCRAVAMDLASDASMADGLKQAGPIDVLVNNAGVLWDEGLWDDPAHFDATLSVMLRAPYRLMQATVPTMGTTGRVVNISSDWGSFAQGLGGGGGYAVAKAGLNALTVRAASQAPKGVKINAMCPGWVRTRMGGASATRDPAEAADTAVWLATLPDDGPTGGFFRDRKPLQW